MISKFSSNATRKLAFRYILESIDYRKKCMGLQDIISQSKMYEIWRQALINFFDTPLYSHMLNTFCKN